MKKYVAIIKNTKKVEYKTMLNYLENEEHENHKEGTQIISIDNKNYNEEFEEINAYKILKNKRNKMYRNKHVKIYRKSRIYYF